MDCTYQEFISCSSLMTADLKTDFIECLWFTAELGDDSQDVLNELVIMARMGVPKAQHLLSRIYRDIAKSNDDPSWISNADQWEAEATKNGFVYSEEVIPYEPIDNSKYEAILQMAEPVAPAPAEPVAPAPAEPVAPAPAEPVEPAPAEPVAPAPAEPVEPAPAEPVEPAPAEPVAPAPAEPVAPAPAEPVEPAPAEPVEPAPAEPVAPAPAESTAPEPTATPSAPAVPVTNIKSLQDEWSSISASLERNFVLIMRAILIVIIGICLVFNAFFAFVICLVAGLFVFAKKNPLVESALLRALALEQADQSLTGAAGYTPSNITCNQAVNEAIDKTIAKMSKEGIFFAIAGLATGLFFGHSIVAGVIAAALSFVMSKFGSKTALETLTSNHINAHKTNTAKIDAEVNSILTSKQ